jgi:hypothetical protein
MLSRFGIVSVSNTDRKSQKSYDRNLIISNNPETLGLNSRIISQSFYLCFYSFFALGIAVESPQRPRGETGERGLAAESPASRLPGRKRPNQEPWGIKPTGGNKIN